MRELRHWGPNGPPRLKEEVKEAASSTADGSARGGASKDERKEEAWQSSAEDGDAAATWDAIQFQRASNLRHRRQKAAGSGGRGSGLHRQLSLDSSPAALSDSLHQLTAFASTQPARVTRSMAVRLSQDETAKPIHRTQSSAGDDNGKKSGQSPHRTFSQPLAPSQSTSLASASPPPSGQLVVSIPDRAQRAVYSDDIPSPSILNITCERCHTDVDEELLLLCDGCDEAYHTYCLIPQLTAIPDDEWFCPQCQLEESLRLEEEHTAAVLGLTETMAAVNRTPPRRTTQSPRRPRSQQRRRMGRPSTSPHPAPVFAPYDEEEEDDEVTDMTYNDTSNGRAERAAKRAGRRVEEMRTANLDRQRHQQNEARLRSLTTRVHTEQSRATRLQANQRIIHQTVSSSSFHPSSSSSLAFPSSQQSRTAAAAPSSSLSRLSSSSEEALPTLAARMRELQLQKQREREEQKEREMSGWMQRGLVESLLDEAVTSRGLHPSPPRSRGTRGPKREPSQPRDEEDSGGSGGSGGRVRRKMPRKSPSTFIRPGSTASTVPAQLSFASLRGSPSTSLSSLSSLQPTTAAQTRERRISPRGSPPPAVGRGWRDSSPASRLPSPHSSSLASLPSARRDGASPSPSGGRGSSASPSLPPPSSTAQFASAASRGLVPQLSVAALGSTPRPPGLYAAPPAASPASIRPSTAASVAAPTAIPSFEDFLRQSAKSLHRLSRSPYRSPPTPQHSSRLTANLSLSRSAQQQSSAKVVPMSMEDDDERPRSPFLQ